jgi:hypothetical protein
MPIFTAPNQQVLHPHGKNRRRPRRRACNAAARRYLSGMRFHLFFCGLAIIALGGAAGRVLERPDSIAFITDALTLGGGIIICGLFSFRMPWIGFVGAGVLALLGAARGIENLAALPKFWLGDRSRGVAPVLESGAAIICILLLVHVVRALFAERTRRMLSESPAGTEDS